MEFKNFFNEVRSLLSEAQNCVVKSLSVKKRSPIAGNYERESIAKRLGLSHTLLLTVGGEERSARRFGNAKGERFTRNALAIFFWLMFS